MSIAAFAEPFGITIPDLLIAEIRRRRLVGEAKAFRLGLRMGQAMGKQAA